MIEWILTDNNVSIFDIIVVVIIAFIFCNSSIDSAFSNRGKSKD